MTKSEAANQLAKTVAYQIENNGRVMVHDLQLALSAYRSADDDPATKTEAALRLAELVVRAKDAYDNDEVSQEYWDAIQKEVEQTFDAYRNAPPAKAVEVVVHERAIKVDGRGNYNLTVRAAPSVTQCPWDVGTRLRIEVVEVCEPQKEREHGA